MNIPDRARLVALALATAGCLALSACESSQSRSAKLKAAAGPAEQSQPGVTVSTPSSVFSAEHTTVLTDPNGTAVVVGLTSSAKEDAENVPIQVVLRDASGAELFSTATPGLQHSLTHAAIAAGDETSWWVNDQIPITEETSATVTVGDPAPGSPPPSGIKFEIEPPELAEDPASGTSAVGMLSHDAGTTQERVLVTIVARKRGRVVAAGRAIIARAKAGGRTPYTAFFIGDPKGAELIASASLSHDTE